MATVIKASQAGRGVKSAFSRIDLSDHVAEARETLGRAREQAAAILAAARQEAERLGAEALKKAEQEGRSGGYAAGYADGQQAGAEAGYRQAFESARAEFAQAHAAILHDVQRMLEEIGSDRRALHIAARRDVLELALQLARKLTFAIGVHHRETAAANLDRVLTLVLDRTRLKVQAHPSDIEALRRFAAPLLTTMDSSEAMDLQADDSIAAGGCVVLGRRTEVDARLETQLDEIVGLLLGRDGSADGHGPREGTRNG